MELHEQTCKYPDVTPPATVEEESQEETLNTAQLDLSDLFNASALTNPSKGLQHQLKHQQKRLGQLESATHELEAARLAPRRRRRSGRSSRPSYGMNSSETSACSIERCDRRSATPWAASTSSRMS